MFTAKRFMASTAAVISAAALAAPAAATARYVRQDKQVIPATSVPAPATGVYSRQDKQMVPPVASPTQPILRVSAPTGGLSPLSDVGIGFGGLALTLLALGGAVAVTRSRHPRDAPALTH